MSEIVRHQRTELEAPGAIEIQCLLEIRTVVIETLDCELALQAYEMFQDLKGATNVSA